MVEGGGLENRYTLRVSGVQIPFSPPFFLMANGDANLLFSVEAQLHSKGAAFSSLPRRNAMKQRTLHEISAISCKVFPVCKEFTDFYFFTRGNFKSPAKFG